MDAAPAPARARAPREITLAEQLRLVAALRAALAAPGAEVACHETHISFVLVAGAFAYKLRKAVNPGFLDFTTLARRRADCDAELRLNRRLAPALYLDVVAIGGTPDAPRLGAEPAIDFALRMRAFDPAGLWDRLAARGALQAAHVDALAARIAGFHARAPAAPADGPLGTPAQVRAPLLDTLAALEPLVGGDRGRQALDALRLWEACAFAALEPVFAERLRAGRVREGHGDLHLGNVVQIDGRTTVFDCIEFSAEYRWIDVVSEIAFMAMDLHHHRRPDLAHRFVNAYLEASGDYAGVRVLRYYLVQRALVRAKVAALRAAQAPPAGGADEVAGHLALALDLGRRAPAVLLVTHGPSGSGKTTLTQGLVEALGAIRVRADVERKRLHGLAATTRSGSALHAGLYGPGATAATYARMGALATAVLEGGCPALLDATFLQRWQRDGARRVAAAQRARFVILDFAVDEATLRERVASRQAEGGDASEAGLDVLAAQLRAAEPLGADEAADVQRVEAAPGAPPHADWAPLQRRLASPAAA